MKDFVEFLVKSLVKMPESASIEETGEGTNFRYKIHVHPSDMGIIIGKEGRTINSVRLLAKARAVKDGTWVDIEIADENPNA